MLKGMTAVEHSSVRYGSDLYVPEQIAQPILAALDNKSFFIEVKGQVYHYDFSLQQMTQQYSGQIVGGQYEEVPYN